MREWIHIEDATDLQGSFFERIWNILGDVYKNDVSEYKKLSCLSFKTYNSTQSVLHVLYDIKESITFLLIMFC